MPQYATSLYLALWNSCCLGLVAVLWAYGFVADVFAEDVSRLSWVCAGLLLLTIVQATRKTWLLDRMLGEWPSHILDEAVALPTFLRSEVFLCLGVCGTVIGLSLFAKHMQVDAAHANAEGIAETMASMPSSLQTAFHATLVAVFCKLWVEVISFIQERRIRELTVRL